MANTDDAASSLRDLSDRDASGLTLLKRSANRPDAVAQSRAERPLARNLLFAVNRDPHSLCDSYRRARIGDEPRRRHIRMLPRTLRMCGAREERESKNAKESH